MKTDVVDILNRRGQEYVQRIQANLSTTGTDASGETSRSVFYRVQTSGDKVTLLVIGGRKFFPTVETGSRPSKKNPSPEMIKSLDKWRKIRGIIASAWGIAKTILRDGSRLWQRGGRKDIYTVVREQAAQEIKADILKIKMI